MKLLTLLCFFLPALLLPVAADSIPATGKAGVAQAPASAANVLVGSYNVQAALAEVPEPQALVLLGIGLLVTARLLRKRDAIN